MAREKGSWHHPTKTDEKKNERGKEEEKEEEKKNKSSQDLISNTYMAK